MYLYQTLTGPQMYHTAVEDPFGPHCAPEEIKDATRLEIWCTKITDPGNDYTEFRFIGPDGNVFLNKRINGY